MNIIQHSFLLSHPPLQGEKDYYQRTSSVPLLMAIQSS